ncbi:MAG: protein kinase [Kofleriaceae bacterium]
MGGSSDTMPAASPSGAGLRQIGRYSLTRRLGAGAMGEVYVAFDMQLDREIAIKVVHPALARKPESAARMLREARAMAKLSHRSVVAIHDAGEADGQLFLAMELVRGKTLADRFIETGDWRTRLRMVIEAGHGLAAAHAAGVLHRDFKPDNVLVDHAGRVAVSDFGLAMLGGTSVPSLTRNTPVPLYPIDLTQTGALLGTPSYMSLEQVKGGVIDARADQFAFCVVAYEALYGQRPYRVGNGAEGLANLMELLENETWAPAPTHTDVPPELRAAVLRGMSHDPKARWPSLEPLLAVLERGLVRRRSWKPYAFAGLAALAAGTAVTAAVLLSRDSTPAPTASLIGPTALRSALAISHDGRVAIGTDHVEIRDFTTGQVWTAAVEKSWCARIQFLGEGTVRYLDTTTHTIWRWDFTVKPRPIEEEIQPNGTWLGGAADGDLVRRSGADDAVMLALVNGKRTLGAWQLDPTWSLEVFSISPDGRKFAYLAGDRFKGHIVVLDTKTGTVSRSSVLADVTSLAWHDDHSLVYGDATTRSLDRVTIDGERFGKPVRVRTYDKSFPAQVVLAGDAAAMVISTPATSVHVDDRVAKRNIDLETARAAGELGWTKDGAQLTWNPSTKKVEQREKLDTGYVATPLPIELDIEPVNASVAGDLLIIATRDTGGRKLVARSMTTGKVAWELPPGEALLARCAADLQPPCFIARQVDRKFEIWPLDLVTGRPVDKPIYRGPLEDFAIDAAGEHIAIAEGSSIVQEQAIATGDLRRTATRLGLVRSVAYDPKGGMIVSGSAELGRYSIGHLATDGTFEFITDSEAELLSLVRPSPNGNEILSLGRALSPTLWRDRLDR